MYLLFVLQGYTKNGIHVMIILKLYNQYNPFFHCFILPPCKQTIHLFLICIMDTTCIFFYEYLGFYCKLKGPLHVTVLILRPLKQEGSIIDNTL